jgi:hypothetical protein
MKGLADIKASILCAASHGQLNHVVDEACAAGRYHVAVDLDYEENAELALRQGKPAVAEILQYAHKRARQL